MLALSRNTGQKIILDTSDGKIEVCLIQVNTMSQAVIGISAPKIVEIAREELLNDPSRGSRGSGFGRSRK